ncbi:MAG: DUF1015 family protein, partial [Deltaproteobacteria bacterium]|nr:DUF1015 family protein [Deltaproteobacteria bacterium]
MPRIEAFQGTFYNPAKAPDPAAVTAPPYDVITGPDKAALLQRSPFNIIRLILGKAAQEQGHSRPESEFAEAAATCRKWLDDEILLDDQVPALYDLEEEFEAVGKRYIRRGFIGR